LHGSKRAGKVWGMNLTDTLTRIQFLLGRASVIELVKNEGSYIVVKNNEGRWFTADVTKTGKLKKNSVRLFTA
jgi:hypothetical protein